MRTSVPIQVKMYLPQTEEGHQDLARRVAGVHADAVVEKIKNLPCSKEQKQALIDDVLKAKNN